MIPHALRVASWRLCVVAGTLRVMIGTPIASAGVTRWTTGGPSGTTVLALAPLPTDPRVIFAGTAERGLFKSTDGGATWQPTALADARVPLIVIDARRSNTVYAQLDTQLLKSTDAGVSWVPTGLDDSLVTSLAIDPEDPRRLYAAAFDQGVLKSTDGGVTWVLSANGLPVIDSFYLIIEPTTPTVLYAGSDNDEGAGGVFMSTDSGETWLPAGLQGVRVVMLVADPLQRSPLVAAAGPNNEGLGEPSQGGVYETADGGATWETTGLTDVSVTSVAIDPRATSMWYATVAHSCGVLASTDAGVTWMPINAGLPNPDVFTALHVVIDPAGALYVATDGAGVWKSTDAGATWTSTNVGLPAATTYATTTLNADDPLAAYAGTPRGLFLTTNSGRSWDSISMGLHNDEVDVQDIAVDLKHPATVYAATVGGVIKSTNRGATWTSMNQGLSSTVTTALVVDPINTSTLYVVTPHGVFKTTDAGARWQPMNQGLGLIGQAAIAIAPDVPQVLYLELSPGLYKSTDGAADWQGLEQDLGATSLVAVSARNVFAASGERVFGTTDGGASWRTLLSDGSINAVAADPASPAAVYAAGENVWRSTDAGRTWATLNDGLDGRFVRALAVGRSQLPTLYAATSEGVFVSADAAPTPAPASHTGGCSIIPREGGGPVATWMLIPPLLWICRRRHSRCVAVLPAGMDLLTLEEIQSRFTAA